MPQGAFPVTFAVARMADSLALRQPRGGTVGDGCGVVRSGRMGRGR